MKIIEKIIIISVIFIVGITALMMWLIHQQSCYDALNWTQQIMLKNKLWC